MNDADLNYARVVITQLRDELEINLYSMILAVRNEKRDKCMLIQLLNERLAICKNLRCFLISNTLINNDLRERFDKIVHQMNTDEMLISNGILAAL